MNTWILLLRGINIGGRNILRMETLRKVLSDLGLSDVRTYIQSGNAVFRSRHRSATALRSSILKSIDKAVGLQPDAVLLDPAALREAIASNPFDTVDDPRRLYLFFLTDKPLVTDLESLERLRQPDEGCALIGKVFYLNAPAGMARSKLGAAVEKMLGVAATARNWRTVNRLAEMASVQPEIST